MMWHEVVLVTAILGYPAGLGQFIGPFHPFGHIPGHPYYYGPTYPTYPIHPRIGIGYHRFHFERDPYERISLGPFDSDYPNGKIYDDYDSYQKEAYRGPPFRRNDNVVSSEEDGDPLWFPHNSDYNNEGEGYQEQFRNNFNTDFSEEDNSGDDKITFPSDHDKVVFPKEHDKVVFPKDYDRVVFPKDDNAEDDSDEGQSIQDYDSVSEQELPNTGERGLLATFRERLRGIPHNLKERYHQRVGDITESLQRLHDVLHNVISSPHFSPENLKNFYEKSLDILKGIQTVYSTYKHSPDEETPEDVPVAVESSEKETSPIPEPAVAVESTEEKSSEIIHEDHAPDSVEIMAEPIVKDHATFEGANAAVVEEDNASFEEDNASHGEDSASFEDDSASAFKEGSASYEEDAASYEETAATESKEDSASFEEDKALVTEEDNASFEEENASFEEDNASIGDTTLKVAPYNFYGESVRPLPYQYGVPYYPPLIPTPLPYYPYIGPYLPYYNYIRSPAPFNHNPAF